MIITEKTITNEDILYFNTKGLLSMQVGVAKKTIYYYLTNKPTLPDEVREAVRFIIPPDIRVWNKEMVEESVSHFIKEYGRVPYPVEFKSSLGLPSKTIIKGLFDMSVPDWLRQEYGYDVKSALKFSRGEIGVDMLIKNFIEEYERVKPTNCNQYNHERSKYAPTWQAVAKALHITKWSELQKELNIRRYTRQDAPEFVVTFDIIPPETLYVGGKCL